jgi:hypothetical protein
VSAAPDLAERYAPGEDVSPLLRSVGAGLAGALLALGIDWLIPTPPLGAPVWPVVVSAAAIGDPSNLVAGVVILLLLAVVAAIIFTYGQFRRFVPGPPLVVGVVWASALWLVAGPLLLPRAAGWLSMAAGPTSPLTVIGRTALIALELTAGMAAYGVVLGALNPRRPTVADPG